MQKNNFHREKIKPETSGGLLERMILHEENDLIVLNKPAGLQVHPDNRNRTGTLANYLLADRPRVLSVGEYDDRPGIVHRLDRDTAGLMIVVKSKDAFLYYKDLFKKRKIQKTYWALVHGKIKEESGVIDTPIGITLKNTVVRTTSLASRNKKEALTIFRVRERFCLGNSSSKPLFYTLVEVTPKTGRTHQIRVHLKSIGHPIVGDNLYKFKRQKNPGEVRTLFLLSKKIEFVDQNGRKRVFEVPPGNDWEEVLKELRERNTYFQ